MYKTNIFGLHEEGGGIPFVLKIVPCSVPNDIPSFESPELIVFVVRSFLFFILKFFVEKIIHISTKL